MPYKDPEKQKEAQRKHYQKNKQLFYERTKKRRLSLRKKFVDYKSNLSCSYCGKKGIACIDFHHNGDEEKNDTVANVFRNTYSWDRIINEIKKCDPVCANCHRKLHKQNKEPNYSDPRKNEIVKWFYQYKETLQCETCGENYSCCLDFHHVNPEEKEIIVGVAAGYGWSKKRILKEIDKCRILCANCHRELHYG